MTEEIKNIFMEAQKGELSCITCWQMLWEVKIRK